MPQRGFFKGENVVMVTFITILQLICGLLLIVVVLFQSGKSQGLSGAIGGISDSYMSKTKAKSMDARLARATKWIGAVFVVLTLVLNCMVAAGL
jgi:preprotein translocase subunit SecG